MAKRKHAYKKLAKPPGHLLYTGENTVAPFLVNIM